ncbi:GNAT family N-acetyltransferase [Yoonia sp. BS5-3]|uniref:GNAT family N-acetyltransferase n=1 Tax=Yoonia phaeophyticola TaxID=3137369 RepID=A0ABZ2V4B2_9RHOB
MKPWLTPPTGFAAALTAQLQATVPVLETERLRLRAPRIDEFDAYCTIFHSERWPHEGGSDLDAWLDYNQMIASWLLRGIGLFSIEAKADGTHLGFAAIDHEWGDPEVEIGWMLNDHAEGQGVATEAGQALLDFARSQGRSSVVSYVDAGHPRSAAVSTRLGGQRDAAAEAALSDTAFVFRHELKEQADG